MAVINILTKQGKEKTIRGNPRSLAFRQDVKGMFDVIDRTKPYLKHWEKCKEVAKIFNVTPHRVYQILQEYGY